MIVGRVLRGRWMAGLRGLLAAGLCAAACLAQARDHWPAPLGPAAEGPAPVRVAGAALAQLALVDGDRVLLRCGERYAPLQLHTRGGGTVRIEPAGTCPPGLRPTFDGRRAPGGAATGAGDRQQWPQAGRITQVFAGDLPLARARYPASGFLVLGAGQVPTDATLPADPRIQGRALAGALLHARTQEWTIEQRRVAGDGRSLDQPLRYPLRTGAGLFLSGKPWMLGTAPAWAHDEAEQMLTVQGAGGQPVSVVMDEPLLQVQGSAGIVVQGIDLMAAGNDGLRLKSDATVVVRDVGVRFAGGHGVAVAGAALAQLSGLRISRSGGDGVFFAEVRRAEVRDSVVSDAGLLHGDGDQALAAINAHRTDAALIEGNRVERAAYIGIRVAGDAVVRGNRVAGACRSLSDCAAIYTWRRNRDDRRGPVQIIDNLIVGVGVGTDTSVKFSVNDYFAGVYLDEWTRRTEVRGNVVADAAQGIYLHNSFDNLVAGNLVLAPRAHALLELVDPALQQQLKAGPGEPPNRMDAALLERRAVTRWALVPADDVAALRAAQAQGQVLVIDGLPTPALRAALESGDRRCRRLLPAVDGAALPAQAWSCGTP